MSDAIASRVEAYRETRRILARELPSRILVVAMVGGIVALGAGAAAAFAWTILLSVLLSAEAALYRRLVPDSARHIPTSAAMALGAASVICNLVAIYPILIFMQHGTPALHFAASAYMAGLLINLIVNNGAHPTIFAFAAAPSMAAYIAAGVNLSWRAKDPTAAFTTFAFVVAALIAYGALAKTMCRHRNAVASAESLRAVAERASLAKSEFLSKMSHEIKTPLNGILGMAQAMGADILAPGQKDRLQIIVNSGGQLLAILNDVLDHGMIESGAVAFDPAPASLSAIVERATAPYREIAVQKRVVVSLDLTGAARDHVFVDKARLEQCVSHVVSNAVKFTQSGGVFIALRAHDGAPGKAAIEIVVRDTGVGMTADEVARVFEPFEQADNSIRRSFGGVGLGLAVSRGMLRAMGGDIVAESAPGRGSEFILRLTAPTAESGLAALFQPHLAGADTPRPHPSVLVVEDNLVNFQVIRAIIDKHSRNVAHAENGAAALARLESERFDIVFMDMHMPVMDGLAATREIRASRAPWSQIPIVFLTAAASAEEEGAAYASGADAFLAKPVRAESLLRALSAATCEAA